ncbi:helix-turn-helix domain-containing protein [Kitasatospora sp. HPMI-4]|uniref:helix-turn-helix domain-containing protein n=1 Tax=Kitasatospora sp. HPMI-4 TaxID=3448443 RepID=UPI003F1E4358
MVRNSSSCVVSSTDDRWLRQDWRPGGGGTYEATLPGRCNRRSGQTEPLTVTCSCRSIDQSTPRLLPAEVECLHGGTLAHSRGNIPGGIPHGKPSTLLEVIAVRDEGGGMDVRQCSRCGCALSRYNGSDHCGPCDRVKNAVTTISIPARAWSDPTVRDALACWDLGSLSRRLREIVPLRQEDMSELTGLSQGHLSKLESGRAQLTHVDRILEFLTGLGVPSELMRLPRRLGLGVPTPLPLPVSPPAGLEDVTEPWTASRMVVALQDAVLGESMERRRFLVLSGSALTAYMHHWGIAEAEPMERAQSGGKVIPSLVEHYQGTIDDLRHMDANGGSGGLADITRVHLSMVTTTLQKGRYDERLGRWLAGIAADTATQLGWMHFDAGRHGQAQRTLLAALRAAHASGDARLGVGALSYLAILSYSVGNPRDAVTAMQAAREKVKVVNSPYLQAMLLTRQARGHARLGEKSACLRAIGRAAELEAQGTTEEDPGWLYWINRGEILGQTASCHLDLGEHREAAAYFEQAHEALNPADLRTRALFASRAASAHLMTGEREAGYAAADSALSLAEQVHSTRLNEHLETVARELRSVPGARAAELLERSRLVITKEH